MKILPMSGTLEVFHLDVYELLDLGVIIFFEIPYITVNFGVSLIFFQNPSLSLLQFVT